MFKFNSVTGFYNPNVDKLVETLQQLIDMPRFATFPSYAQVITYYYIL